MSASNTKQAANEQKITDVAQFIPQTKISRIIVWSTKVLKLGELGNHNVTKYIQYKKISLCIVAQTSPLPNSKEAGGFWFLKTTIPIGRRHIGIY